MGDIVIDYGDLKDVAKHARRVADKCDDYVEELSKKLTDKRNSLPASPTGKGDSNIASMCYYVNAKKQKLEKKQGVYKAFASKVETFSEHAKDADDRVAKTVNNSRDNFLREHKNLKGDGWTAFFASITVECPFLGKLFEWGAAVVDGIKDLKNNLRYWYEVCGGKKLIDNILAVGEVVLASLGLVIATIALFSNPVGWVTLAGFVGALIGFSDAIINIRYQLRANMEKDPAWAKYYGSIDTTSDMFRKQIFKSKSLNRWSSGIAIALDVTSFVCSVIDIADSVKSMYKRSGLKKLFSSPVQVDGKKVYKFDFSKMWHTVTSKDGWSNIKKSLKCSWKGLVFGDKGKFTQRWKRAFTSKDTAPMKRVEKITKMLKYTLSPSVKITKIIDKGFGQLSKDKIDLKDIHGYIKNSYSATGWSGGTGTVLDSIGTFAFDMDELRNKLKAHFKGKPQTTNPAQELLESGMRRTRDGACMVW